MRLEQKHNLKTGVSLIAVLLFMLVATIAATATYKWITSESRSSSSRMLEREAYQSAVAGIESARSWMTYHANDVGALIRQYKTHGNAAIKLNDQLAELVRPGQKFNVWLTGVSTENATYKLKLVSEGVTRNGQAKHTEVAILNVSGLYNIKLPTEHTGLNFEEAFQGRSTGITGDDAIQSGIINGDWTTNNVPKIGNLIVTGNINYGGTVVQTGNLYVKGSLNNTSGALTFGSVANNNRVIYIGEDVTCADNQAITVYGDLYVGGDVDARCAIDVKGNMTVGGILKRTNSGTHGFSIGNNLVFKESGALEYSVDLGLGTADGAGVGGNTYLSRISGTKSTSDDKKINLGNTIYLYTSFSTNSASATVCSKASSCSDGYCQGFYDGCGGSDGLGNSADRYFLFKSTGDNVASDKVDSWSPTDNVLRSVSGNYWKHIEEMNKYGRMIDASTDEVPQAILLKDTANWKKMLANDLCNIDPHMIMNDAAVEDLNKCYNTAAAAGRLYEGFLPIRWDYNQLGAHEFTKQLEHNFIIYVPRKLGQTVLPPTAANAVVLLYLGQGAGMLMGSTGLNDYNYFVYSKGDIEELNKIHITGSVMMEPGKTLKKYQGGVTLEYKSSVLQTLINAGLIEENPEYTALVNPDADPTAVLAEEWDDYYIGIAPQLSITVETQYANKEKIDNLASASQTPDASFIVLPRVIYLPRKPSGTIDQYYSVVPLNSKDPVQNKAVSCANEIPVGSPLSDGSHKLEPGIYTCHVSGSVSGKQSNVPFYVVVSSADDGVPAVSFGSGWEELRQTEQTTVTLNVPVSSGVAQTYTVTVSRPADIDGWSVVPINPTNDCSANSSCTFTISSNVGFANIFTVTNNSADVGQLNFQITGCENGCVVGSPYVESIMVSSNVTVNRASLETWCAANGNGSSNADKAKCAKKAAPDCVASSEWVQANGYLCSVTETNNKWNCKNTGDISLKVLDGYIPNGCEAVVPGDNLIPRASLSSEANVTLYASLKAKQFTFSTGFSTESAIGSNQKIRISVLQPGSTEPVVNTCSYADFKDASKYAEKCQVQVYFGSTVTLSFPTDSDKEDFNYWMCETGSDCPSPKAPYAQNSYTLTITGDDVVYAHFKEKDKHCFFDEFKNASYKNNAYSGSFTNRSHFICAETNPEKEYCLDVTRSYPNAKWRLVSGNSDDIQFDGDGRISLKSSVTRRSKENEKKFVTIMSTAEAGRYGTLKAQFQVPREEVALDDEAKLTVKQSGFLLRSEEDAASYLMLNVFSDRHNNLKARICVDGGNSCETKNIGNATAYQGNVILIAATLEISDNHDVLVVKAYTNPFSVEFQAVSFDLTQAELNGVQNLVSQENQYVGYRLSDQNFKLYGIGWKSDDYDAECWDTYPSISCSFRAAYTGGLVPKGQNVKPWVGFSRWFDDNECTPDYYYNGTDANCTDYVAENSAYKKCPTLGYYFSGDNSGGPHGNTMEDDDGNIVDGNKTARAGVSGTGCNITGEQAPWANSVVAAHCGTFWVGEFNNCTEHLLLQETITDGAEGSYFGIDASGRTANFRGANLIVTLDNPNGAEVSVYLFSRNSSDGYTYGADAVYSQPYTSTSAGSGVVLNINVNDISNVDGFDPEKVVGAYVKYDDASGVTNVSVHSRCPNAMSLFDCRAEYNQDRNVWNVYATVKNGSIDRIQSLDVPRVKIGSTETNLDDNTKDCSTNSEACAFTAEDISWELTLDHSPYYYMGSNESVDYQFWVTMKDKENQDVEGSPCKTRVTTVSRVKTSCRIADDARSKKQGLGLPVMTYSILGCPAGKCGYTIKVYKDGAYVTTIATNDAVSGNITNMTTAMDAYNNPDSKMPVGTYKMVLESSKENYPFMACEQEFEILDERTPTGNLSCSMPEKVMKGSIQSVTVTNTLPKQNFWIYLDDGAEPVWRGEIAKGRGITAGSFKVPEDNESHTFVITKAEDTEIQCRGSFTTADAMICDIQNEVKTGEVNKFLVDVVSGVDVTSCSYTAKNSLGYSVPNVLGCGNNCTGTYLSDQSFTVSTNDPVTLTAECQLYGSGTKVKCSVVAAAELQPPVITCPESPIYAGHNETVTVSPISVENCGSRCSYWFITPNGTKKGQGFITNQTSVSFPGSVDRTNENTYKLVVSNEKTVGGVKKGGTAECDVIVDYSVPQYTCPDDMEAAVGTEVAVIPKSIQACPPATWAWGGNIMGVGATFGCSYTVTGGSFTAVSGDRYHTGKLPKNIKGETAVSTGDGTTYTLTLTNDVGVGTSCTFNVKYVEPSCDCSCDQGCDKLKYEFGGKEGSVGVQNEAICVFAKEIKTINENWGKNAIYVNGQNRPGYCTTEEACTSGIEKLDGGYYIQIPATKNCWNSERNENCEWIQVQIESATPHERPVCPTE